MTTCGFNLYIAPKVFSTLNGAGNFEYRLRGISAGFSLAVGQYLGLVDRDDKIYVFPITGIHLSHGIARVNVSRLYGIQVGSLSGCVDFKDYKKVNGMIQNNEEESIVGHWNTPSEVLEKVMESCLKFDKNLAGLVAGY